MTPEVQARLPGEWSPPSPEPGWSRDPALAGALRSGRDITRAHARSFYFSSFPLPRETRCAAFAVYAFCRHVDDRVDDNPDPGKNRAELKAELMNELHAVATGTSALPFAPALAAVNRQYGIDDALYLDLIEGCCLDREKVEIETWPQLELYCYHVASVVGLIMSRIFGLRDGGAAPRAVEMGIAMQLTNILRDVGEDLALGRVYLPREELAALGLDRAFLERGRPDERWRAFMREQIARARDFYRRAEPGVAHLAPPARPTARMMARIYAGILDRIEAADYQVFDRRVYVSFPRKLRVATGCLLGR